MVTFDWRMLPGTMTGRHIIGAIELSSAIKSTSPRSSHLNFLFAGNLRQSLIASFSPGKSGASPAAPPGLDGGPPIAGGVPDGGAGGVAPGSVRVPMGG